MQGIVSKKEKQNIYYWIAHLNVDDNPLAQTRVLLTTRIPVSSGENWWHWHEDEQLRKIDWVYLVGLPQDIQFQAHVSF